MVTVYPNPPPVQDLYGYNPMVIRTGGPGLDHEANGNFINGSGNSGSEDPSKKIRKPYTITKSRENWTELEHDKFLEALQLFDRDWKKIEAFVGSKTVIQIRSHAQKYFQKIQKNGANEHVPPPRPKRKASHPYPHKALKNVPIQSSATLVEPEPIIWSDSLFVPESSFNPFRSSWDHNTVPGVNIPRVTKGITPDFAQVYSFISTVFDPNASDHLQTLRNLDPINVETVLMLMKNLSTNLINPEFEDHVKLLSSESAGIDMDKMSSKAMLVKQE